MGFVCLFPSQCICLSFFNDSFPHPFPRCLIRVAELLHLAHLLFSSNLRAFFSSSWFLYFIHSGFLSSLKSLLIFTRELLVSCLKCLRIQLIKEFIFCRCPSALFWGSGFFCLCVDICICVDLGLSSGFIWGFSLEVASLLRAHSLTPLRKKILQWLN